MKVRFCLFYFRIFATVVMAYFFLYAVAEVVLCLRAMTLPHSPTQLLAMLVVVSYVRCMYTAYRDLLAAIEVRLERLQYCKQSLLDQVIAGEFLMQIHANRLRRDFYRKFPELQPREYLLGSPIVFLLFVWPLLRWNNGAWLSEFEKVPEILIEWWGEFLNDWLAQEQEAATFN